MTKNVDTKDSILAPERRDGERGQSMVEYAFILILVAMVCIVLVTIIGHHTGNLYSNISSGLST